jgi:predicted ATPase
MKNNIFETIEKIPESQYYPYISHIRFPYYKKLKPNLRIDFSYPITALIGSNGSSKSSVLRAIYGSPEGYSIGSYWFESNMDKYYDEDSNRKPKSAFIYGYYNTDANRHVEVKKTRVRKENDPDYWEPARPSGDMEKMPDILKTDSLQGRTKTRWNTIKKNVAYLDFRHEAISAFDKFFYNGKVDLKKKKVFVRSRSKYLNTIIKDNKRSYIWRGKEKLKKNKELPQEQIEQISKILNKRYASIRIIEHSFYTSSFERTIYVSSNTINYSEAFAGSGEFAIISLVMEVMEAKEKSLIILDEPETSVHPEAQRNLMLFLAEQVKEKKHQIVFATHSPTLIENLPPKAINVFYELQDGTIDVRSNAYPEQAFKRIGASFDKKTIIVEDKLAQCIIEKLLRENDMEGLFDVKTSPGGDTEIKTISVVDNAIFLNATNALYLLDGDKRKEHKNPKDIPESENAKLGKIIKEQTNCDVNIPHSSDNQEEKIKNQRKYLDFYYKYVKYLPSDTPENLIWDNMTENDKQNVDNSDRKECFKQLSEKNFGKTTAEHIFKTQEFYLNKIDIHNNEFKELLKIIESCFSAH